MVCQRMVDHCHSNLKHGHGLGRGLRVQRHGVGRDADRTNTFVYPEVDFRGEFAPHFAVYITGYVGRNPPGVIVFVKRSASHRFTHTLDGAVRDLPLWSQPLPLFLSLYAMLLIAVNGISRNLVTLNRPWS